MTFSVDYSADFGATPPHGTTRFVTAGGLVVTRTATPFEPDELIAITKQVDDRRGGVFSSGMEYPGRYSRWHTGYIDPCVEFTCHGRELTATALNERGTIILPAIAAALRKSGPSKNQAKTSITIEIPEPLGQVPEERRSRRPTVFSAIREVIALFACADPQLGLYGAFGYDLAFQLEPLRLQPGRDDPNQGALWLHLPDELYVIDRKPEPALRYSYDFAFDGRSTAGLVRTTPRSVPARRPGEGPGEYLAARDCPPDPVLGEYAKVVEQARERFAAGDLFAVVPSQ